MLPGFTDSHVHFPTWSLSRRDVRLEGVSGLAEALERVRAHPRHGTWIRGTGWRSAEWEEQPTAAALDAVTGDVPALLFSKDYHSAWLNSAALGTRDRRPPGRRRRGRAGREPASRPGSCARSPRGSSAPATRCRAEDEFVDATREGLRIAASRGVVAIHDKDGWLGAPRHLPADRRARRAHAPRLAVVPYERLPELEALACARGSATTSSASAT